MEVSMGCDEWGFFSLLHLCAVSGLSKLLLSFCDGLKRSLIWAANLFTPCCSSFFSYFVISVCHCVLDFDQFERWCSCLALSFARQSSDNNVNTGAKRAAVTLFHLCLLPLLVKKSNLQLTKQERSQSSVTEGSTKSTLTRTTVRAAGWSSRKFSEYKISQKEVQRRRGAQHAS